MKIALFGGTFNPIHNGHLIASEAARSYFGLDRIIFLPGSMPVHKEGDEIIEASDRYNMVTIATSSNPYFYVSPIEMYKEYNYTCDTISYFKKELKKDDELYYIIGLDSLKNMGTWKKGYELLDLCNFIVVSRVGEDIEIMRKYKDKVLWLPDVLIDISATEIRKKIKNKESIKYLMPDAVEEYICSKHLYI